MDLVIQHHQGAKPFIRPREKAAITLGGKNRRSPGILPGCKSQPASLSLDSSPIEIEWPNASHSIAESVMKLLLLALCFAFGSGGLAAKTPAWQPSLGHMQIPIWPGAAPDAQPSAGPEIMTPGDSLVAGRPWTAVERVSQPTMTVYPPKGKNSGAAVVVFPGGGYKILAIDLEGTEVCDWLTSRGVTCVLLKYRVPFSGEYWDDQLKRHVQPKAPMALEDAQRTVGLVRFHAAAWHIDPHKIGVLGFSAGGHMVAAMSTHFAQRLYPAVDAADQESCRPDFAVAIYPGHLSLADNSFGLNPDIAQHITRETPPTFLLQNEDDQVDRVEDSLSYYAALKKAAVPVEMHLYARGGHAFGLRHTKLPVTDWPRLVETWLGAIGMIPE
jgi:acetyl esterase/lipase